MLALKKATFGPQGVQYRHRTCELLAQSEPAIDRFLRAPRADSQPVGCLDTEHHGHEHEGCNDPKLVHMLPVPHSRRDGSKWLTGTVIPYALSSLRKLGSTPVALKLPEIFPASSVDSFTNR